MAAKETFAMIALALLVSPMFGGGGGGGDRLNHANAGGEGMSAYLKDVSALPREPAPMRSPT